MDRVRPLLLHVALPLVVGAAIYLGWRDQALLGWSWAEVVGASELARALRASLQSVAPELPEPMLFTLPDALWVYALTFLLARLHARSSRAELGLFLSIPVLLGPVAELLQRTGAVPGTFDPLDLLATFAAFGAALLASGVRDHSRRAPPPSSVRALETS